MWCTIKVPFSPLSTIACPCRGANYLSLLWFVPRTCFLGTNYSPFGTFVPAKREKTVPIGTKLESQLVLSISRP